jgi:hypothetical protein
MARGQSKTALSAFRAEQDKFTKPAIGAPVSRDAAQASPQWRAYGARWGNYDQYNQSRGAALQQMPPERARYWSDPPRWVQDTRPAYGGYSGSFMASLLGGAAGAAIGNALTQPDNAQWAYSHANDPAYQQWHGDVLNQARERHDDALQQQIDSLDAQVATLQAQHAPTTTALPAGVDPALVVAPNTVLLATAAPESHSHWGLIITVIVVLVLAGGAFMLVPRRRRIA